MKSNGGDSLVSSPGAALATPGTVGSGRNSSNAALGQGGRGHEKLANSASMQRVTG